MTQPARVRSRGLLVDTQMVLRIVPARIGADHALNTLQEIAGTRRFIQSHRESFEDFRERITFTRRQ